jgi:molybdopterin molybdotransferase
MAITEELLSVHEAQAIVLKHVAPRPPEEFELTPEALGLILAEDVTSDLDMPPHDKALMDGYAVRAEDLPSGQGTLTIIEEIVAGQTPKVPLGPDQAARIMTGAPVPLNANAVIPVERTRRVDSDRVEIRDRPPTAGLNIMPRGKEMRRGEVVLRSGARLRPQEFGVLSTVGRTRVKVYPRPRVAVVSTGDELVEPGQTPGPGQIRNGNSPMLLAQVARAGAKPHNLGIARDNLDSLKTLLSEGLQAPVLVLSGGVSAGKLDLVPGVLKELGVQAHFHKVAMKPGKPILFGTRGSTLVFGLPGNPVSSLACFELFVRPALRRLMGHRDAGPRFFQAALQDDFKHRADRPTYHPARLHAEGAVWTVEPVSWFGSPDLLSVCASNAFVLFPPGEHQFRKGAQFPVLWVEDRD